MEKDAFLPVALELNQVSYSYTSKSLALDTVSFSVSAGSFAVLLGANGAGKTTLYSLSTRLFNTQNGNIHIFGCHLKKQPSKALSQIGVVFQRQTLDLDITVKQNLHYHAALHGMSKRAAHERANHCMIRHEIQEFADHKVGRLSGGQRRRVEIARALIHEPRLLLLDEPTVGLDINSRQDFISHVRSLCTKEKVGVLWSTHLIDEVELTDYLVVLEKGQVVGKGIVSEVLKQTGTNSVDAAFKKLSGSKKS